MKGQAAAGGGGGGGGGGGDDDLLPNFSNFLLEDVVGLLPHIITRPPLNGFSGFATDHPQYIAIRIAILVRMSQ